MQDISFILLGFFTGLSLILAIGAQNIFVIEQGLKKQHVFLVSLICSISDLLLIFLGWGNPKRIVSIWQKSKRT